MCFDFKKEVDETIKKYLSNLSKVNQKKYQQIKNNSHNNFMTVDTSFKKCPDNYIGYVSNTESNLFAIANLRCANRGKIKIKKLTDRQRIVVILESPHKSEFRSQLIAPALGVTGERIHSHLWKILQNAALLTKEKQDVYLVNAIQYQCSLGFDTSIYRDMIFNAVWKKKEGDLLSRIRKIKPSIIIVASTDAFNKRIVNCVKRFKEDNVWQADSHPSVWHNGTRINKV